MVYNRCIGTRFCSNNCPYKVRRFNWLDWVEESEANQGRVELQRNPEVSVRERGVMEKCTYCVQRIRHAEIEARVHDRPIATRNVRTACQQVCPTEAITFGSLGDAEAPVVQLRQEPRSYAALHDTNAQPRTMYLARIENPNPELKS
jgi:molybdopterin-containing oxidoreductase family iron-sulfur binding subunit